MKETINVASSAASKTANEPRIEELLRKSAELLGKTYSRYGGILHDLQSRLLQQRFHLAVLGQFKRGKSTLINALLGEPVLPSAIIPVTSIPTFVRFGETISMRVSFLNGREPVDLRIESENTPMEVLSGYVTENGNPNNRLGVSQVEVRYPLPLLRSGIVIIDTPGIGSTHRHNTETTLNFLAQCDAALFVLSIDPPPTEVEIEFLKEVRSKVTRIFFALNKVDYISPGDRHEAEEFIFKVLREQTEIKEPVRLFPLSARLGLEAKKSGDARKVKESGIDDLEEFLKRFVDEDKAATLRGAIIKKALSVLDNVRLDLELSVKALKLPIGDIEAKLKIFEQKTDEMESRKDAIRDMIAGDRRRVLEFLESESLLLKENARAHFKNVVETEIGNARSGAPSYQSIHDSIAEAVPVFFVHQLGNMQQVVNKRLSEIIEKHCRVLDEFLECIRNAAADIFEIPHISSKSVGCIEIRRKPYWVTGKWSTSEIPDTGAFLDAFFSASMRKRRIVKRLYAHLDPLLLENVEHTRFSLLQAVENTFVFFNSEMDKWIEEAVSATHDAVKWALEKRTHTVEEVSGEIAALETTHKELMDLIIEFENLEE
jgi:small GTP-binding protein